MHTVVVVNIRAFVVIILSLVDFLVLFILRWVEDSAFPN